MTQITLTPELEKAIEKRAKAKGTTTELAALDTLRAAYLTPEELAPAEGYATLADFLEGFIGTIHSGEIIPGGARMSEDIGKKFTEGMVRKYRG